APGGSDAMLYIADAVPDGVYTILKKDRGQAGYSTLTVKTNTPAVNPFVVVDAGIMANAAVTTRLYTAVAADAEDTTVSNAVPWLLHKQSRLKNTWNLLGAPAEGVETNSDTLNNETGHQ